MLNTAAKSVQHERVDYSKLWWVALMAAGIAAVVNGLLFVIGDALGYFPASLIIPSAGQALTIGPVLFLTIVGVLLGALVYAGLGRFTTRPVRWFRIVALVILVLSFSSPLSIPNPPVGMVIFLEIMHIVAGIAAIVLLTTLARRQPNEAGA